MTPTKLRWAIFIALVAAATIAIHYEVKVRLHAGFTTGSVRSIGRLAVGDEAPDFTLTDLRGESMSLASLRGRKVVLLDQGGDVGGRYGVRALPTVVVIDRQGKVRRLAVGHSYNDSDLRRTVTALAREP